MLHREVEERDREQELDCAPCNEKTGNPIACVCENINNF